MVNIIKSRIFITALLEEERKAYRLQAEESSKQIQVLQGIKPFMVIQIMYLKRARNCFQTGCYLSTHKILKSNRISAPEEWDTDFATLSQLSKISLNWGTECKKYFNIKSCHWAIQKISDSLTVHIYSAIDLKLHAQCSTTEAMLPECNFPNLFSLF